MGSGSGFDGIAGLRGEGVDEFGADEGCRLLLSRASMVGVDEESGGVGGHDPVLEFGRAHDCYDAVLVWTWGCPDGSKFGNYVLFEDGVFVVEIQ